MEDFYSVVDSIMNTLAKGFLYIRVHINFNLINNLSFLYMEVLIKFVEEGNSLVAQHI